MLTRPVAGEYGAYYDTYVSLVPDGDFATVMTAGHAALCARLAAAEAKAGHAYAPGKWTVAEALQHVVDTERVFAYRLLALLRGDASPLPSFDENAYAPAAQAGRRTLASLVAEFEAVRASTVALVESAPPGAWTNVGTMSGKSAVARALPYIIAGHERHHDALFRDRYGV